MGRILVVEDDATTRQAMTAALRRGGHEVSTAADGAGAMIAAQRQHPELVVLDLGLPAGDGFVVMQRLKAAASTAGVPVVVVSARDPGANEARARASGAVAYLQKPLEPDALNAAVLAHLPVTAAVDTDPGPRRTVLLVATDVGMRAELGRILASAGVDLVFASDAVTAGSAANRLRPRLVFMAAQDAAPVRRLQRTPQFTGIPVAWLQSAGAEPVHSPALADVEPTPLARDAVLARLAQHLSTA